MSAWSPLRGLQAGVEMAAGVLVVDLHGHVHLDAAERVDDVLEAVEVDFRIVRDGHAGQLRHRIDRERGTPDGVRGVQLVLPVFAHVNQRIAVDGHEGGLLVHRVDAREDDAVAAELVARELLGRLAVVRPVGTHEQDVEGFVREVGFHERVAQLIADAVVEVPESTW